MQFITCIVYYIIIFYKVESIPICVVSGFYKFLFVLTTATIKLCVAKRLNYRDMIILLCDATNHVIKQRACSSRLPVIEKKVVLTFQNSSTLSTPPAKRQPMPTMAIFCWDDVADVLGREMLSLLRLKVF